MKISHYQYNHPKNYIGFVVAQYIGRDWAEVERLTKDYVVAGVDTARRGAQHLNLVEETDDGYDVTERGWWLCHEVREAFELGGYIEVLEEIDRMRGARERFIEHYPGFVDIGPDIVLGDPAIKKFTELLEEIHRELLDAGCSEWKFGTAQLFWECWNRDAEFAGEWFIRNDEGIRKIVLGDAWYDHVENDRTGGLSDLDIGQVESIEHGAMPHDGTTVYRSATTYQIKNILWHLGVLQRKGVQANEFGPDGRDPDDLTWALEAGMYGRDPEFEPTEEQTDG